MHHELLFGIDLLLSCSFYLQAQHQSFFLKSGDEATGFTNDSDTDFRKKQVERSRCETLWGFDKPLRCEVGLNWVLM